MTYNRFYEHYARVKQYLRFKRAELQALIIVGFIIGFIYSMAQDLGETLLLLNWAKFFVLATIVGLISLFLRLTLQKIMALKYGYYAQFKVFWEGMAASLVFSFLSMGALPLVFPGNLSLIFMVRQRIGDFRYGYNFEETAIITLWGLIGNIYLATIFAMLNLAYPGNFFFKTGMLLNIIMGICFLLPLPWLEGLQIFFGSRFYYGLAIAAWLLSTLLLLSGTKIGIIILILVGAIALIGNLLWGA